MSYAGIRTPTATRTLIARLGNECPFPLDDGRKWGDRRESNSRGLVHSQPPEPLCYGHIWWIERESNSVPLAGGQKPNQSATLAIYGAESGSPTRLCSLEDCHLRRSVNPAYGSARLNRTGLAALPKQFIAINDWAEQNGSGGENRTRVAALRVQCSAA